MFKFFPHLADFPNFRREWRRDLVAGVTVGIVALPLALAFGITTGTSAASGLITAVIAGIIAALFGGSSYQVSGPTGAMTVVLVPIVGEFGPSILVPVGISAGILVLLAGFFRAGSLINKVPWPVMEGFTLGIALVIAIQQIPSVFATSSVKGFGTVGTGFNTAKDAIKLGVHWSAILIVFFTLLLKFSYPKISHKLKITIHIPASFVAIIGSTLLVTIFQLKLPKVGDLPKNLFQVTSFPENLNWIKLIIPIFEVAILAAIESLLSARVADGLTHRQDAFVPYQPNRELYGQGLASIFSSIFGGMPATGAIARTGVNVRSGARTRAAAAIHAVFLLAAVFLFNPLIAAIPSAALAGVLIGTSYRIARPAALREALSTTRLNAAVLLITAAIVLFVDLIWGIGVGTIIYLLATKYSKAKYR